MPTVETNTIKIYLDSEITLDKNREIDDIETYLSLYPTNTNTFTDTQYFKHGLHKTLKLNLNQVVLGKGQPYNIDYVSIQNTDDLNPIYYFVDAKRWISENTVELTLTQDTINSHKSDYTLSDKTKIIRMHKNRYIRTNISGVSKTFRLIDKTPEGLCSALFNNDPQDYFINEKLTDDGVIDDADWFLIFGSNKKIDVMDENPINCYTCASKSETIQLGRDLYSKTYTAAELMSLCKSKDFVVMQMIMLQENTSIEFLDASNKVIDHGTLYKKSYGSTFLQLVKHGTSYYATMFVVGSDGVIDPDSIMMPEVQSFAKIKFSHRSGPVNSRPVVLKFQECIGTPSNYHNISEFDQLSCPVIYSFETVIDHSNVHNIVSIKGINRTFSKLNKIIMIPYRPFNYGYSTVNHALIVNEADWIDDNIDGKAVIRLINNWEDDFRNVFEPSDSYMTDPLAPIDYRPVTYTQTSTRLMEYESKLYNSEFYQPKVVYDTYGFTFLLENVDPVGYYVSKPFKYEFVPTTQMISAFLFKFPSYQLTRALSDYDGVMQVERNNEIALYQNAYLNYMRTSYNWDQKAAKRAKEGLARNFVQRGLTSMNTLLNQGTKAAGGYLTSNYDDLAAGALGAVTEVGSLLIDAQSTIAQANQIDENMARKIDELQSQATTANGMSDALLSKEFNANKLKMIVRTPSENLRNLVWNFFHYFGYACEEYGNPRSSVNSRYWFNFIQADIVFAETSNMPVEVLDDIKMRYSAGITVMHKHVVSSQYMYDVNQQHENFESFFFN